MNRRILSASLIFAALSLACGQPLETEVEDIAVASDGMSWEEFLSVVYQEPETGVYIVDGDTPISDDKHLYEFWYKNIRVGLSGQPLIVNTIDGVDGKWTDSQKLNLTYCVSDDFGSRYQQVVDAMAAATGAWEAAANVNYIHVSSQDSNCTNRNNNVLFDVNPVNAGGQYLARAFFPGDSRRYRNVLIDGSSFTTGGSPDLTGILRHELGHTLGFRHEHTRPEAGTCFEDNNWRALTSYDSDSVMHYPQCNGTGDWSLTLTSLDKSGAASLYGAGTGQEPTDPTEPPPSGTESTETWSGSVARREFKQLGSISVVAGTELTVTMTGSGDPDLYVRFGAEPTSRKYDCRPYLTGAEETCTLTVPSGFSTAFIAVNGYTAGSYSVTAHYYAP